MNNILITAHAGCMNTPDDSIESVKVGIASGADTVEVDVRFNEAGIPVLSHDSFSKDKVLDTVYDCLKIVSEVKDVKINCDLKEKPPKGLQVLFGYIKDLGLLDRAYFTGVEKEYAQIVCENCPDMKYLLNYQIDISKNNVDQYIDELIDLTKKTRAFGLNPDYRRISPKLVSKFHENGLKVYVWTINNEEDVKKAIDYGVDAITTKDVPLVRKVISNL